MLEHFHETEHVFVKQVLEIKERLQESHEHHLTKFLSPREVDIYKEVIGNSAKVLEYGGYKNCERNRLFISKTEKYDGDFQISCLKLTYNRKFGKLNHKNIFGALMRLGLEREKYGDVYISKDETYLFLCSDIAEYVKVNLTKIDKMRIHLEGVNPKDLNIEYEEKMNIRLYFLHSMRLDLLVANVCIYARTEAEEMIEKGLVKVNHKIIEKGSHLIKAGDVVSVRGYGRLKIVEEQGMTKNDRHKVLIGRIV